MSERETRIKTQVLAAIGGVNERPYLTELRDTDWNAQQGVFVEYNGEQSRLWGKRTLAKYPDAIYGIHQFWTPFGYAGGLYQFDGKIDFGTWLTPTSKFDLTPIDLGTDGAGYTLDDFGFPINNEGYRSGDACVLSFLDNSTDHSSCSLATSNVGTPDDSNGGPAGQGTSCSWQEAYFDEDITFFMVSKERAAGVAYTTTTNTLEVGGTSGGGYTCVAATSAPPALGPNVAYGAFSSTATAALASVQVLSAWLVYTNMVVVNPSYAGPCLFAENYTKSGFGSPFSYTDRCILNFSQLLLSGRVIDRVTLLATLPSGSVEIPLDIEDYEKDMPLDMLQYREQGIATHPSSLDSNRTDSVEVSQVRVHYRERVCA